MPEEFPELRATYDALTAEKATIVAASASARAQRAAILEQIRPLETNLRAANAEIADIERPRLAEIDMQLGTLAKAMGGRSLSGGGT